jgi:hypothetical protein
MYEKISFPYVSDLLRGDFDRMRHQGERSAARPHGGYDKN